MYKRNSINKPGITSEASVDAETENSMSTENSSERKRKTETNLSNDPENVVTVDRKATKIQAVDQREATLAEFGYTGQAPDADYSFALELQEAEFTASDNNTSDDTYTSVFPEQPASIEPSAMQDQPKTNKTGPYFFGLEHSDSKRIFEPEMKSSPTKRKEKQVGRQESSESEDVTDLSEPTSAPVGSSIRRKSIELEDVDKFKRIRAQLPQNSTISETMTTMQPDAPERHGSEGKVIRNTVSADPLMASTSSTSNPIQKHKSESYIAEVSDKQNPYSFAFDILGQYEQALTDMGYTQVFHTPVPENHPFLSHPQMKPVNDKNQEVNGVATFTDAVGHSISGKMSARAFEKEGRFYMLMLRQIFSAIPQEVNTETIQNNLKNESIFKEFPDGVCISLIVLVRNPNGIIEEQLRLIPNGEGGHPGLVFKNEGPTALCIIAAGEIYILNGEIILVNDKSGNFNAALRPRNLDQKAALDLILSPFYAEKYKDNCFFAATKDDAVIVYEVLRRGFPLSLIRPRELAKKFPLSSLPKDIQDIAIASEKAYQERVSQQKEKKLAATPKPSRPDNEKSAAMLSSTTTTTTSTSVDINAPVAAQPDFQKPVDPADDKKQENKNMHTEVKAPAAFGVFARTNDDSDSMSDKTIDNEQVGENNNATLADESSVNSDSIAENLYRSKN